MNTQTKNASMTLLTKVAARDRAVALLVKQAALSKSADWNDFVGKVKGYANQFGDWVTKQDGWKDLALGGGAAALAGTVAHGLQGKKKKPVLTTLAALSAAAPAIYWGKDIRNFAGQQWNKYFNKPATPPAPAPAPAPATQTT